MGEDQRIAVGRGFRDELAAEDAAGAGLVLDDELLPHLLGELLRQQPRDNIAGVARRAGHHNFHRASRIVLRLRNAGKQRAQHDADDLNKTNLFPVKHSFHLGCHKFEIGV